MDGWMQWEQGLPGRLRYLAWSCCGSGVGVIGGVVWAFVEAAADRSPEWEINEVVHTIIGACVGGLIGVGIGLLAAWVRRPRHRDTL